MKRGIILENVRTVGAQLHEGLRDRVAPHPLVGEVRGRGLVAGVELVADKRTREQFPSSLGMGTKLRAEAINRGLILRAMGPLGDFAAAYSYGR